MFGELCPSLPTHWWQVVGRLGDSEKSKVFMYKVWYLSLLDAFHVHFAGCMGHSFLPPINREVGFMDLELTKNCP